MPIGHITGLPRNVATGGAFLKRFEDMRPQLADIIATCLGRETEDVDFTLADDPTRRNTTPSVTVRVTWEDPLSLQRAMELAQTIGQMLATEDLGFGLWVAPTEEATAGIDVILEYGENQRYQHFEKVRERLLPKG